MEIEAVPTIEASCDSVLWNEPSAPVALLTIYEHPWRSRNSFCSAAILPAQSSRC